MNGTCFEMVQNIKAAMTVQLRTRKRTFRTASKCDKNKEMLQSKDERSEGD